MPPPRRVQDPELTLEQLVKQSDAYFFKQYQFPKKCDGKEYILNHGDHCTNCSSIPSATGGDGGTDGDASEDVAPSSDESLYNLLLAQLKEAELQFNKSKHEALDEFLTNHQPGILEYSAELVSQRRGAVKESKAAVRKKKIVEEALADERAKHQREIDELKAQIEAMRAAVLGKPATNEQVDPAVDEPDSSTESERGDGGDTSEPADSDETNDGASTPAPAPVSDDTQPILIRKRRGRKSQAVKDQEAKAIALQETIASKRAREQELESELSGVRSEIASMEEELRSLAAALNA